jgi:RNA polymerase sigma-70 factor (ECF subfamily)
MAVKLDRWVGSEERSRDDVFAELYESSYPSLVKYCRGLIGDNADPEEVAQEAFLRAWMSWDRYSSSRPFWALVATIARNLCMDHHRHERVVSTVLEQRAGELSSSPTITPDEFLEQDEEYRWAAEALAQLCPNHQRLLRLREIDGWSADEIAAADGTSVEAATAALYRARQRLRDAYNRVAAGAMAGFALFPFRGIRRRFGLWAHLTGQAAASSPALAARAGDAVATVVAIAVVSGSPIVNPIPQAATAEQPAAVVASAPAGYATAAPGLSAAGAGGAPDAGNASSNAPGKLPFIVGTAPGPATPVAPQDVTFTQFTAPTPGSKSHDIYASGTATKGCVSGSCPVLFRSPDGGGTWQQLRASGYAGGPILLPSNFEADNRLFAAGPRALQVSTDNGATFATLAPLGGPATISPTFSSGDPRILLGAVPGWAYDDAANNTTPLQLQPRPAGHVFTFAFSPAWPKDNRLFVGSSSPGSGSLQSSTVTVCFGTQCGSAAPLSGAEGAPTVVPSRTFATTGKVFAWTPTGLYRSVDAGRHFTQVAVPVGAEVQGVVEGADGTLYAAFQSTDDKGKSTGGLFATHDDGKTWTPLGLGTPLAKGASSVSSIGADLLTSLPTGGLLCSADAGKTWAKSCPVPAS